MDLVNELKEKIIRALNLEDMRPEDIDENAALFGESGWLDSIDALEIIVMLEKEYGIRIENAAQGKTIFSSVAAIADYVTANRKK